VTLQELAGLVERPPFDTLGAFPLDLAISPERRASLATSIMMLHSSASSWTPELEPLPPIETLLTPGTATILSFSQQSVRVRRFIVEVLLSMIEFSHPTMLLYIDEAAAFIPPDEATAPSRALIEAPLGGTDFLGVGVALVAEEPGDLHPYVAELCETWIVGPDDLADQAATGRRRPRPRQPSGRRGRARTGPQPTSRSVSTSSARFGSRP
jgi:hypothetical protein